MRRILILGDGVEDKYLGNLIRECKKIDQSISFDFFDVGRNGGCLFRKDVDLYVSTEQHSLMWMYAVPKLRGYLNIRDFKISLREFVKNCKNQNVLYDVCQIHFLNFMYADVISDLRTIAKKIVLTPWGSDVLRARPFMLKGLRKLVRLSDVVTAQRGSRFEQDVKRILDVPQNKLYDLDFGVKAIDEILAHPTITVETAKEVLGITGNYAIVIGYNASFGHNHLKVIEQIATIKNRLPSNYLLVLPLTYGGNPEYKAKIKKCLDTYRLNHLILDKYMSNLDVVNLRMATDLFIHAQTSDANSGTIAEYLLCQKKIINPVWITYPHYEAYGSPFYLFSDFEELPEVIISAIQDSSLRVSPLLKESIRRCGWGEQSKEWVALYYNV